MRRTLGLLLLATAAWTATATRAADLAPVPWPARLPADSTIPAGPLGDAIRLGQRLTTQTQVLAKGYVGNGLTCSSCHLDGGKTPLAAPFVGLAGVFPEFRSRSARVEDLSERINDCFRRSMNGKPLPFDSDLMRGMLSYIAWLSRGVPTGYAVVGRGFETIALPPADQVDAARGKLLFAQKCSACHGADGQGLAGAGGTYVFPPLWGPQSFNDGAGMARLGTAAAFVQAKMPLGAGGTLGTQDAVDIAAYFTRQPRPAFAGLAADWLQGERPADAR